MFLKTMNKDIKILVALLPTLKMFLSVEIDLEFIEAAAWSCFLKRFCQKFLKNCKKIPLLESLSKK